MSLTRIFQIGMPQMAVGCLSENWLLKELGSLHWDTLCNSLRCESNELIDSRGHRLYATFVRIRLELEGALSKFREGDELRFDIEMQRFGRSTLQSTITITSSWATGIAILLSTFSVRTDSRNSSLVKSEPVGEYRDMPSALEAPMFLTEYSAIRAKHAKRNLQDITDRKSDSYPINPFTDSNGANLLYFAAYQSIADFLSLPEAADLHTRRRDIFYFRNSELTDSICRYPLSSEECLLFRCSDGECIAFISTLKEPTR